MNRSEQDDKEESRLRRSRCNDCPPCRMVNCGRCENCLDMKKFDGPGKKKQACGKRRCEDIHKADDEEK